MVLYNIFYISYYIYYILYYIIYHILNYILYYVLYYILYINIVYLIYLYWQYIYIYIIIVLYIHTYCVHWHTYTHFGCCMVNPLNPIGFIPRPRLRALICSSMLWLSPGTCCACCACCAARSKRCSSTALSSFWKCLAMIAKNMFTKTYPVLMLKDVESLFWLC